MRPLSRSKEHVRECEATLAEAARVLARECGPLSPEADPGEWETVEITAADLHTLLADWLNRLRTAPRHACALSG